MNIPNEEYLGSIIMLYNGLNFKNKFNLSSEEYKYLRKKYKIYKLVSRENRICWKCDNHKVSKNVLNTNMCDMCYRMSIKQYFYNFSALQPEHYRGIVYNSYWNKS